ncbi:MAG: uroporphyrinogen-III synthase [Taibaiella sp.]|nr:uroporphyrinogen-III synthase [Taibaiella sp.]
MPEQQIHILSTKELDPQYVALADENGIVIDRVNFIQTIARDNESDGALIRQIATTENTVVFTSANAVYAVADSLEDKQPLWNVYCMEGKTTAAVKEQLPGVRIIGKAPDATTLAEKIIADNINGPLYFFCGNLRMDDLPAYMRKAGVQLTEIVVYETILTPVKINRYYDGIIFYSPSGVSSFFMENSTTDDVTFFTIGATTAKTLSNFMNETVISPKPDINTLVQTIINYYKHKQT